MVLKELYEYCNSDVNILRRGCRELRKQFLEIANIDPIRYITIAAVCMAIYRSKYIKKDTIAVVDNLKKDQYSQQSISWLNSFHNPNIKHALNDGEVRICGSKVDGFDEKTNTVYQYHGCFWHGCIKCYSSDFINNKNKTTMKDLYEQTIEKSEQMKKAGFNLIEMWECYWTKSKEYKEEMKQIKSKYKEIEELNPRNAFFGDRTNATKLKVKGKKMKYIDICSLYPTVQCYDDYPVEHPTKIFKPPMYNSNWYGLIKCAILPPRFTC
jgi:G:T-mismatch repair DNA endonuclease (very short patch repair protein)